jgi:hypothetical protein
VHTSLAAEEELEEEEGEAARHRMVVRASIRARCLFLSVNAQSLSCIGGR